MRKLRNECYAIESGTVNAIIFYRFRLIEGAKYRWQIEGLNSLNYQLLSYKEEALYTHVYVSVRQSEVTKVCSFSVLY